MSISFSGLASGLDTASWVDALVSVKQSKVTTLQSQLTSIQKTKSTLSDTRSSISSLRTAVEKLTDAKFGGTFDLFSTNNAVSSNDEVFSAVATSAAVRQNYNIAVQQLATYTKAVSVNSASAIADDDTKLSTLGVTEGAVTTYVNGKKHTVEIEDGDTLGDLKTQLSSFGIKLSLDEDGIAHFEAQTPGDKINIGATTDGSNFLSVLGIDRNEDGTYSTTNSLYKASSGSTLTSENAGFNERITEGTFTIGNAVFNISDKTTLSSLITEINNNDDAQAYAFWDDATGKLSITSTKEGASYINIEAGSSNFTDVMGFTETVRNPNGTIVSSQMYTDAQELGKNAIFTVNGTAITSSSNTVTPDISRIAGVTLTLNRTNTEEDGETTLKVSQDTEPLMNAVKGFIEAYNSALSKIDEVTANGADLHGETTLTSLKNTIRNYATGQNEANGGVYKMLAEIGISTASANAGDLNADTQGLKFDEKTFLSALAENPDSVKSLLAGDNGIFSMIENTIEQSLQASTGFFDVKNSTLDSNIKRTQTKITSQNKSIETYKTQLEAKFQKMEQMIAQMQQNYSSFLS